MKSVAIDANIRQDFIKDFTEVTGSEPTSKIKTFSV